MTLGKAFMLACVVVSLVVLAASNALADPKAEIGASLMSVTVGLGDNDGSTFGIPSGGFGILNPGVYTSIFLGSRFAVEPQIGLIWASFGGDSEYILNFVGQFDYFFSGINDPSLYAFASGGIVSASGGGETPKSVSGGVGYRIPVGDRLTFRVDGRYTHFTDDGGNALSFGLSIGGLFGQN